MGNQRRPETGLWSRQGPGGGHTGPKRPPSETGAPRQGTAGTRWQRGGRLSPFLPTLSIRLTQTKRRRQPDPPKDFFKQTLPRPGQPAPRRPRSETPPAVWEAGRGGGRSAAGAGPTATPEREPVNGGGLTALRFRSRARALGRELDGAPQWTNSPGVSACVAGPGESAAVVGAPAWERVRSSLSQISDRGGSISRPVARGPGLFAASSPSSRPAIWGGFPLWPFK